MKKKFKKIAAVALSCVLTLGTSLNAFAADNTTTDLIDSRDTAPTGTTFKNTYLQFGVSGTTNNDKSTRDIYVTIEKNENKIYRVDVEWDSTNFTYKFGGEWSPESHTYGDGTFYVGATERKDAKIKVSNHSNAEVTVAYEYTAGTAANGFTAGLYTDAAGSSLKPSTAETLDSADLSASYGDFGKADSDTAFIVLGGAPTDKTKNGAITVGTVTVKIGKAN